MLSAPEIQSSAVPDRLVMLIDGLDEASARYLATDAVYRARQVMPRVSGAAASRLMPVYGRGHFGIFFPDRYTWFQERGTGPHTMRSLAGKTIPMWVTDADGSLRRDNPKARTRLTEDGRLQVLIFRRAARLGQRRVSSRRNPRTGALEASSTPASYPGAPGRINRRVPGQPWTPVGARGGQVAAGNVGVRWRHPGLRGQQFLNGALAETAFTAGLLIGTVYAADGASWEHLRARGRA